MKYYVSYQFEYEKPLEEGKIYISHGTGVAVVVRARCLSSMEDVAKLEEELLEVIDFKDDNGQPLKINKCTVLAFSVLVETRKENDNE